MLSLHEVAKEYAQANDVDVQAAVDSARIYLGQMRDIDGIAHDEDDLDEETGEFLLGALEHGGRDEFHAQKVLDEITEVTRSLETSENLQLELIRKAVELGANRADIATAAGMKKRTLEARITEWRRNGLVTT